MQASACAALLLVGAATVVTVTAGAAGRSSQQASPPFVGVLDEHPDIQYAVRPPRDRIALLTRAITQGSASITFDERSGYLRSVLEALGVPSESQLLVFSKTGIQRGQTSSQNPRAIFFNESVVVGYVAGARFLELAAHDPQQGVVFYTLDQTAAGAPAFTRQTRTCLSCHVSSSTLEVPGLINRSNFMGVDGDVLPMLGSHVVNHQTPLPLRWGGWYVTGNYTTPPYGGIGHMGNVTVSVHPVSGPATTSNEVFIQWLNSAPETRGYLSADSDIAALMVFDHQAHAINLLTRLNWEARVAQSSARADFGEGILRELVDGLTDYLLFVDEVPPPARVTPRAGFAARFAAAGPTDSRGRSLRQLDLENRLLRYPCSYMIYTDAFDHLPEPARRAVYERMWSILSGRDTSAKYSRLSAADRTAIREILRETKRNLPEFWRP